MGKGWFLIWLLVGWVAVVALLLAVGWFSYHVR